MGAFWKAASIILVTVVFSLVLSKKEKDLSLLLIMAATCMTCITAIPYLEHVLDFLRELESAGNLPSDVLDVLLKAVGIGLVAELAGLICTDAGCASLGKSLKLLGSAVILYLGLPVFRMFLTLIQDILGAL